MSIFKKIFHAIGVAGSAVGHFFANAFKWVETDGAKIAVAIVDELKTLLSSGTLDFFAQIMDGLTHSNIPTEIVDKLRTELPKATAIALGIQGFPENPTEQDIQNLSQTILTAFGIAADKSQFYSTLGAKIISIIRANTMPGQTFTFATLVTDLEQTYQAYLDAQNADQPVATATA